MSQMTARSFLFVAVLALITGCATASVTRDTWATNGKGLAVYKYTIDDGQLRVRLTNYGARIIAIDVPDRDGKRADVVLGFSDASQYMNDPKAFFGATIGRFANRIGQGAFALDGITHHLPLNNNGNTMHGGPQGFSTRLWQGKILGSTSVEFTRRSADGEMGFPGNMEIRVCYTLSGSSLRIAYSATTDKATVINLTNHTYFNLHGEDGGDVLDQRLQINAERFTPINAQLIPDGIIRSVAGTPFDFRALYPIGARLKQPDPQLENAGGYDHNFVVDGEPGTLRKAAFVVDPLSGRTLSVSTTEPGVQFYSGNFLDGTAKGIGGKPYAKHAGFCLETQHYPDSPNHTNFPSTVLRPGKTFHSITVFTFGVDAKERLE